MGGPSAAAKRRKVITDAIVSGADWALQARKFYQSNRRIPTGGPLSVKVYDSVYTNSNFTLAGTFTTINALTNGPEQYQRIGRRISMRSVSIKGYVNFGATTVQDGARIVIIYDEQPNAALPVLADVFQNSNAGLATSNLSFQNLNNRDRFRILKDYKILLPSVQVAAGVNTNEVIIDPIRNSFNVDWDIQLSGLEATYNAVNGGTVADITTGSLLVLTFDGNNAGTTSFSFISRLRYVD